MAQETAIQAAMDTLPSVMPFGELAFTAQVNVGERMDLGSSAVGQRFMIPIIGGTFIGGPKFPNLHGTVLPGGADRQLLRPDGVKELEAIYELRTHDSAIISVRNRVTVDEDRKPRRYAMSVIEFQAPDGTHDWLNRRLFIGTLQSLRPAIPMVVVKAWLVDA